MIIRFKDIHIGIEGFRRLDWQYLWKYGDPIGVTIARGGHRGFFQWPLLKQITEWRFSQAWDYRQAIHYDRKNGSVNIGTEFEKDDWESLERISEFLGETPQDTIRLAVRNLDIAHRQCRLDPSIAHSS